MVGAEDLVAEILDGRMDFERVLATPEVLPALAKAARVLGPKNLMPNPKRGSVVTKVAEAVNASIVDNGGAFTRKGVYIDLLLLMKTIYTCVSRYPLLKFWQRTGRSIVRRGGAKSYFNKMVKFLDALEEGNPLKAKFKMSVCCI